MSVNSQIVVMIWHTYLYWACQEELNCLRFSNMIFQKNVNLISQLDFRSTESPDIPAEEFDYPSSKKKNKICMFLSGSFLLVFILTLIAFSLIF